MTNDDLIQRIEDYASRRGWEPATVTSRAVGNSRLYARLRSGGSCTLNVAERLVTFMEHPPVSAEGSSPASTIVIDDENNVKGGNNAPS